MGFDLDILTRQHGVTNMKPGDALHPIPTKTPRKKGQTTRDKELFAELMRIHKDPKAVRALMASLKPKSRNQSLMAFQEKKKRLIRDAVAKGATIQRNAK